LAIDTAIGYWPSAAGYQLGYRHSYRLLAISYGYQLGYWLSAASLAIGGDPRHRRTPRCMRRTSRATLTLPTGACRACTGRILPVARKLMAVSCQPS
jgi:hypothetical protein